MIPLLLLACGSPSTVRLDLPAEPVQVYDRQAIRIDARPLDKRGRRVPNLAVQVTGSADAGVVALGEDGLPRCQRSGQTQLELQAGAARGQLLVRCRLVQRIVVQPSEVELLLGSQDEVRLSWSVLDEAGSPLVDIPLRLSSDQPHIAGVDAQGLLLPVAVGKTLIRLRAAGVEATVPVGVVTGEP